MEPTQAIGTIVSQIEPIWNALEIAAKSDEEFRTEIKKTDPLLARFLSIFEKSVVRFEQPDGLTRELIVEGQESPIQGKIRFHSQYYGTALIEDNPKGEGFFEAQGEASVSDAETAKTLGYKRLAVNVEGSHDLTNPISQNLDGCIEATTFDNHAIAVGIRFIVLDANTSQTHFRMMKAIPGGPLQVGSIRLVSRSSEAFKRSVFHESRQSEDQRVWINESPVDDVETLRDFWMDVGYGLMLGARDLYQQVLDLKWQPK